MSAVRVQRKRTKGWKMPENTIYVGRPTYWGNNFKVGNTYWFTTLNGQFGGTIRSLEHSVPVHREYVIYSDSENGRAFRDLVRRQLAGKDLACWCPIDKPCHADVLLEIANQP